MEAGFTVLCGAYSLMGMSLKESGLIDKDWQPVKRLNPPPSKEDLAVVDVFQKLERQLRRFRLDEIQRESRRVMDAIMHLPDGKSTEVNHILTALYMTRIAADSIGGAFPLLLTSPANRAIDMIIDEINKEAGRRISINSARAADNIQRYIEGRPILDDETRNAWLRAKLQLTKC